MSYSKIKTFSCLLVAIAFLATGCSIYGMKKNQPKKKPFTKEKKTTKTEDYWKKGGVNLNDLKKKRLKSIRTITNKKISKLFLNENDPDFNDGMKQGIKKIAQHAITSEWEKRWMKYKLQGEKHWKIKQKYLEKEFKVNQGSFKFRLKNNTEDAIAKAPGTFINGVILGFVEGFCKIFLYPVMIGLKSKLSDQSLKHFKLATIALVELQKSTKYKDDKLYKCTRKKYTKYIEKITSLDEIRSNHQKITITFLDHIDVAENLKDPILKQWLQKRYQEFDENKGITLFTKFCNNLKGKSGELMKKNVDLKSLNYKKKPLNLKSTLFS